MKYYGDERTKTICERKLKYIRCEHCNKKIINNDLYYSININLNTLNIKNYPYQKNKHICCDCVEKFLHEYFENQIDIKEIHVHKLKFHEDSTFNTDYDENNDALVENDELERG